MKRAIRLITLWSLCLTLACVVDEGGSALDVNFEKYELDNGLDVVLHVDRSDPVVAVVMMFHVGSAREVEGRTGLAHLFEHLFFLDSENLGSRGFVVGDAETQKDRLTSLGLGDPIEIDREGNRLP